MKNRSSFFSVPYILWILLFVIAPVILLFYQSFFDIHGQVTLANYKTFFSSWTFLQCYSALHNQYIRHFVQHFPADS